MESVNEQLESLGRSMRNLSVRSFDSIIARHRQRQRRRRRAVAIAGAAVVCAVVASSSAAILLRPAPVTQVDASHDNSPTMRRNAQSTLGNAYPPCGSESQQFLTLPEAEKQLGAKLLLPSEPNANSSNVKTVAVCPGGDQIIVVFNNGVWVFRMPNPGSAPDWKSFAANDPNEAKVGSVNGRSALIITPSQTQDRRGSVTVVVNGVQLVVVGNTTLSADELIRIAESVPLVR